MKEKGITLNLGPLPSCGCYEVNRGGVPPYIVVCQSCGGDGKREADNRKFLERQGFDKKDEDKMVVADLHVKALLTVWNEPAFDHPLARPWLEELVMGGYLKNEGRRISEPWWVVTKKGKAIMTEVLALSSPDREEFHRRTRNAFP
jgi:hypothetical protein